jgi:hypothetical protein
VIAVNLLPEKERQRLYQLAAVRGYRLMIRRRPLGHFVACIGKEGRREPARRVSDIYPNKKLARQALLEIMLQQTGRSAA